MMHIPFKGISAGIFFRRRIHYKDSIQETIFPVEIADQPEKEVPPYVMIDENYKEFIECAHLSSFLNLPA
jgi:hypothetical protein